MATKQELTKQMVDRILEDKVLTLERFIKSAKDRKVAILQIEATKGDPNLKTLNANRDKLIRKKENFQAKVAVKVGAMADEIQKLETEKKDFLEKMAVKTNAMTTEINQIGTRKIEFQSKTAGEVNSMSRDVMTVENQISRRVTELQAQAGDSIREVQDQAEEIKFKILDQKIAIREELWISGVGDDLRDLVKAMPSIDELAKDGASVLLPPKELKLIARNVKHQQ